MDRRQHNLNDMKRRDTMRNYLVKVMTWCGLGLVLVVAGCGSNY